MDEVMLMLEEALEDWDLELYNELKEEYWIQELWEHEYDILNGIFY